MEEIVNAYPMLLQCARHQREADQATYLAIIRPRHDAEVRLIHECLAGPNLLVETEPLGSDERAVMPALLLKVG